LPLNVIKQDNQQADRTGHQAIPRMPDGVEGAPALTAWGLVFKRQQFKTLHPAQNMNKM